MSKVPSVRNEIFKDGFCYVTQKITGDPPVRYLRCCMRKIVNCLATGKMPVNGTGDDFVHIEHAHNHAPSIEKKSKSEFMTMLKTMCKNQKGRVRSIYNAAAEIDSEGATLVPFETVHTSMRKWRKTGVGVQGVNLDYEYGDKERVKRKYNGRRASNIIFKDGFAYVNQKFTENPPLRYLKCNLRNVTGCPATGKMPVGGKACDFVEIQVEHNHPPDKEFQDKTEFKGLLKNLCKSQCGDDLKSIYLLAVTMNPEGAKLVPYKSLQCTMWKWKKSSKLGVV